MHQGGARCIARREMVVAKGRAVAAGLLQAEAGELEFADGRFTVPGSGRGIGLLAVARAASDPANLPDGMAPGLDAYVWNECDVFTFPSGAHVAEVEIDPETGPVTLERYFAVDDYGRVINPLLTDRPGAGRGGAGHRPGDAGAHGLRPAIGPAAERLAARLRLAARRRSARPRHHPRRAADRGQSARRQGLRPGRLHRRAADHHLRDPRRARRRSASSTSTCRRRPSASGGRSGLRGELLEPGEARGAAGGEIAVFPPALDGGEQPPDARSRRDAERGHIVAAEREDRDRPGFGQRSISSSSARRRDLPVGGEQQRQVAIALRAEPVERQALRLGVAALGRAAKAMPGRRAVAARPRTAQPLG